MSIIESPDERRARFLRLAKAAISAAAKTPLPKLRLAYLKIAQHMRREADRLSSQAAAIMRPSGRGE